MRSDFEHFLAALFLQIALAGAEPDNGGIGIDLIQILVHKADQDNRLAGAGRRFYHDGLFAAAVRSQIQQLHDRLFLKIKQVERESRYHVSPTSLSSKLK